MIELTSEFYTWKDRTLMFEALKNGGFFKVGNMGFKVENVRSGFRMSIVATGEELDNKVYFDGMTAEKKKVDKPKIVKKETKTIEADFGKRKEGGLF